MLSCFWILLPLPLALAGQVPNVEGVLGGVATTERFHETSEPSTPVATTPGRLRIKENSGVCETTPGVYQASGYGDLSFNESIWYASFLLTLFRC